MQQTGMRLGGAAPGRQCAANQIISHFGAKQIDLVLIHCTGSRSSREPGEWAAGAAWNQGLQIKWLLACHALRGHKSNQNTSVCRTQAANVHAILESGPQASMVAGAINNAEGLLEDLEVDARTGRHLLLRSLLAQISQPASLGKPIFASPR